MCHWQCVVCRNVCAQASGSQGGGRRLQEACAADAIAVDDDHLEDVVASTLQLSCRVRWRWGYMDVGVEVVDGASFGE